MPIAYPKSCCVVIALLPAARVATRLESCHTGTAWSCVAPSCLTLEPPRAASPTTTWASSCHPPQLHWEREEIWKGREPWKEKRGYGKR
jgi:hypothetical protein